MIRLLRLLATHRPIAGWMALGILLSVTTVLANVTLMSVSGWFITSMALAGAAQVSMNYFTPAAIIRSAAIVRTGGRYLERLVTHEATLRLLASLRVWFYRRLEPLAPAAIEDFHSGDLFSRIRADIDTLDNLYLRLLVPACTALLATLILAGFLSTYDGGLAVVLLVFMVIAGAAVPALTLYLGRKPGKRKGELMTHQRSMLIDSTQGLGEMMLYGAAPGHLGRVAANSDALADKQARLAGISGLSQAAMILLANAAALSVLWLAIPMVAAEALPGADLAMLVLFSLAAFEAVVPMPAAFQNYGETQAAAERLFEITDRKPVVEPPITSTATPVDCSLRFVNVTFTYPGGERPALQDIQFSIAAGARLTIRGASGAGKSSLLQLLARFYEPDEGEICFGNVPISQLSDVELRGHVATATQDPNLFTGTIRDNLLLAKPDATPEQLDSACEMAQIRQYIDSLPGGYDTWVGEAGATLSGGELRRLAMARALLKDSPVLVFDEPTEGLDPTTARNLLRAIDGASSGKTVLLITHQSLQGFDFGPVVHLVDGRMR